MWINLHSYVVEFQASVDRLLSNTFQMMYALPWAIPLKHALLLLIKGVYITVPWSFVYKFNFLLKFGVGVYRDVFNECLLMGNANGHSAKREREKHSPRMQSKLVSTASDGGVGFLPNGSLLFQCFLPCFSMNELLIAYRSHFTLLSFVANTTFYSALYINDMCRRIEWTDRERHVWIVFALLTKDQQHDRYRTE